MTFYPQDLHYNDHVAWNPQSGYNPIAAVHIPHYHTTQTATNLPHAPTLPHLAPPHQLNTDLVQPASQQLSLYEKNFPPLVAPHSPVTLHTAEAIVSERPHAPSATKQEAHIGQRDEFNTQDDITVIQRPQPAGPENIRGLSPLQAFLPGPGDLNSGAGQSICGDPECDFC